MRFFILFIAFTFLTASSINDARKANQAFEHGNYEEAARLYQQAIEADPSNAKLYFNYGNALYHLGEVEPAREAFENYKRLAESAENQALADYNTGKMFADLEMYDEAIEQFREALKNNPNDTDARFNYELALQKKQSQEQDQQQQDQDSDNNEQDENQENQDQDQQQDEGQDQNQDGNQGQNDPQDQDQDQGEQEQQPQPLDMSEQEAQNILDALKQLERELLENRKKESSETQSGNDKDW